MHLSSIKIVGFKSFYQPTTLTFPSNLVVLVGPNGCGKSNIIDAIRWVLGENRTSGLRSDSIEDTIFNGTENYPPVGRASIELVFKNKPGSLAGKLAKQEYIKVRRTLTRDKNSRYYINSSLCRRKDIEELFAGMGLIGKANYAIITQGTVHNLVESKPEHVRLLIEEAANITEYLQKRKETLTHIKNTRINLKQISVVLHDIKSRMHVLEHQAEDAKRYQEVQQELKRLKREFSLAVYQELDDKKKEANQQLNDMIEQLATHKDEANSLMMKKEVLVLKSQQSALQLEHLLATKQEINNQTVSLETTQHYDQQRLKEQESLLTAKTEESRHRKETILKEEGELQARQEELKKVTHPDTRADDRAEKSLAGLASTYGRLDEKWQDAMTQAMEKQSRQQQLQHHLDNAHSQLKRLNDQLSAYQQYGSLRSLKKARQEYDRLNKAQTNLRKSIQKARMRQTSLLMETSELERQRYQLEQELTRINTLLQELTEEDHPMPKEWTLLLKKLNLTMPWYKQVSIPAGWEKAVDQVTQHLIQAHIARNLDDNIQRLASQEDINIALIMPEKSKPTKFAGIAPLATMLKGDCIPSLFNHIYPCEKLTKALEIRTQLQTYESLITPSGAWLGKNWALLTRGAAKEKGLFVKKRRHQNLLVEKDIRQRERTDLNKRITLLQARNEELDKDMSSSSDLLTKGSVGLETLKMEITNIEAAQKNLTKIAHNEQQKTQLEKEIEQIKIIITTNAKEKQLKDAQRVSLEKTRMELAKRIDALQEKSARHSKEASSTQEHREELLKQIATLEKSLLNERQREQELLQHREELLQEHKRRIAAKKAAEHKKAKLLTRKTQLKKKIIRHQKEIDDYEKNINQLAVSLTKIEKSIALTERDIIQRKEENAQLSLDLADLVNRNEHLKQGIRRKVGMDTRSITEQIRQSEKLLERSGEVNQLALRDYEEIKKQYNEKEAQRMEILNALKILESSVRRIDKKSRIKFARTFNNINLRFRQIFSQLTDGGTAYLEEDFADKENSGIKIIAHSRGRRKTTISLLSGGEKTVVAISLIMAIFHLNPSPFCLMDEADAMLDDENIQRFNRMIANMSTEIQFVLITHNKFTVQYAQHLIGITMMEPGISQVVSVDMNRALELSRQAKA